MEKNENEELLEQSPAAIQQEDTLEIAKSGKEEPDTEEQKVSNGRFILWSLAGVYLLYTSYSLCKGYVTGEEGTSMGFMLAGIAFAAIGAGLLFFGIKNMLSEEKIKKAKAAKNAAMEAAAGGELKKEDASGQNRSMRLIWLRIWKTKRKTGKTRKNENIDHIAETVVFFTGTADDVYHLFVLSPAG